MIQDVDVANNIVHGGTIRCEDQSGTWRNLNNLEGRFADPLEGNLRLTGKAVEAMKTGIRLPEAATDIDGTPRGPKPAIGAWEPGEDL